MHLLEKTSSFLPGSACSLPSSRVLHEIGGLARASVSGRVLLIESVRLYSPEDFQDV
jgi:hypothetical protein